MQTNKTKSPTRTLLKFSAPLCAMSLVNLSANWVAMLFVAELGPKELAASALAYSTFISLLTFGISCLYAISILISHEKSHHDPKKVGRITRHGSLFAFALAIPCSLLLWNIPTFLIWLGQEPSLIMRTVTYFHYCALLTFVAMQMMNLSQFIIGIGKPKVTLIITLIRLPFIIILAYGFILGKFGLPQMGLAGIALATLLVQLAAIIIVLAFLRWHPMFTQFQLFKKSLAIDFALMKKIINIGFPIGLQFGGELSAMTIATYFVGMLGIGALVASQIVSQYAMICVMVTLGISQGISVLISRAYGENQLDLIQQYKFAGFKILSIFFAIVTLIFLAIPKLLATPYLNIHDPNNAMTLHITKEFFAIGGFVLWIDAFRNCLIGTLRGLQDSRTPMQINLLCLWLVSLPSSYLLGITFHGGPVYLRIGYALGFILAVVLLIRQSHITEGIAYEQSIA